MIRVNKVKKKGEKITFNDGGLKGPKEYTIKKVVVNEERNRYEYWVSKNKCIMYPINEKVKVSTNRNRTYGGIIEFEQ
jgi:hypothetical protein